ncbi:MAG: hypothetical protein Q9217_004310 [Psora testacea]
MPYHPRTPRTPKFWPVNKPPPVEYEPEAPLVQSSRPPSSPIAKYKSGGLSKRKTFAADESCESKGRTSKRKTQGATNHQFGKPKKQMPVFDEVTPNPSVLICQPEKTDLKVPAAKREVGIRQAKLYPSIEGPIQEQSALRDGGADDEGQSDGLGSAPRTYTEMTPNNIPSSSFNRNSCQTSVNCQSDPWKHDMRSSCLPTPSVFKRAKSTIPRMNSEESENLQPRQQLPPKPPSPSIYDPVRRKQMLDDEGIIELAPDEKFEQQYRAIKKERKTIHKEERKRKKLWQAERRKMKGKAVERASTEGEAASAETNQKKKLCEKRDVGDEGKKRWVERGGMNFERVLSKTPHIAAEGGKKRKLDGVDDGNGEVKRHQPKTKSPPVHAGYNNEGDNEKPTTSCDADVITAGKAKYQPIQPTVAPDVLRPPPAATARQVSAPGSYRCSMFQERAHQEDDIHTIASYPGQGFQSMAPLKAYRSLDTPAQNGHQGRNAKQTVSRSGGSSKPHAQTIQSNLSRLRLDSRVIE